MPRKNVYVSEADKEIWKMAENIAKNNKTTLSKLLIKLISKEIGIRQKLEELQENPETINMDYVDAADGMKKHITFDGRWLVRGQINKYETRIAYTKGKNLLYFEKDIEAEYGFYKVFQTFQEMQDSDVKIAPSMLSKVANVMGEDYVEHLDI